MASAELEMTVTPDLNRNFIIFFVVLSFHLLALHFVFIDEENEGNHLTFYSHRKNKFRQTDLVTTYLTRLRIQHFFQ